MAVYKKIEIIGTSSEGLDKAVQAAVERASKTLRNLKWFEVKEIRGAIGDGKVKEYQVVLHVAFKLEEGEGV